MTRVLVVDDESSIRFVVADALRDAGFEVDTAAHGGEALQRMEEQVPDVILLDLMMPLVNGSSFVEVMRLNARFAEVPVLLLTAAYGAKQVAERLAARACLPKPFEIDDLVNAVNDAVASTDAHPPDDAWAAANRSAAS